MSLRENIDPAAPGTSAAVLAPRTELPPVREWRFHVGAHKTATTHIQYRLEALRGQLADRGLDVILPDSGLRPLMMNRLAEHPPRLWRWRQMRTARLTDPLETLRRGPDRVLVSEELLFGRLTQLVRGQFYDRADYAMALLQHLSKSAPVHVFLATRAAQDFMPSAYAQMLRHKPAPDGGFDAVRTWMGNTPIRWVSLVTKLKTLAPDVKLHLWRYEDYRDNSNAILSELCGMPLPDVPTLKPPSRTRKGSAAAVAAAENLPTELSSKDRKRQVSEIYRDPAHEGPDFDPFTADEKAHFARLYQDDWAEIETIAPDAVMRFT